MLRNNMITSFVKKVRRAHLSRGHPASIAYRRAREITRSYERGSCRTISRNYFHLLKVSFSRPTTFRESCLPTTRVSLCPDGGSCYFSLTVDTDERGEMFRVFSLSLFLSPFPSGIYSERRKSVGKESRVSKSLTSTCLRSCNGM